MHIEKYPKEWWNYINGRRILEYTMDSFTLKDDDGNSLHYSDDDDDEEDQSLTVTEPDNKS